MTCEHSTTGREQGERLRNNDLVVVKIGGGEGNDPQSVCEDIASLSKEGLYRFILFHGVSGVFEDLLAGSGEKPKFVTSAESGSQIRLVDEKSMITFTKACTQVRTKLVAGLASLGINAYGLPDQDDNFPLVAKQSIRRVTENGKVRILRNNLTGMVELVDLNLLQRFTNQGLLLVISPVGQTNEGLLLDVDGDQGAARTAATLGAKLIILSNVNGLRRNHEDPSSLIHHVDPREIKQLLEGSAEGRMKVKLGSIEWALENGAPGAVIGSSSYSNPVRSALLGQQGTTFGNM